MDHHESEEHRLQNAAEGGAEDLDDEDPEEASQLDDVPHEDRDADHGVENGEALAEGGHGHDVAVA